MYVNLIQTDRHNTVVYQKRIYKQTSEDATVWEQCCFIKKKKINTISLQVHDVKFYNQGL